MRHTPASRRRQLHNYLHSVADVYRQFINDLVPRRGEYFTPAYTHHLAHRLPMLYTVALVNIVVLATSFIGVAPTWLSLGVPSLLFVYMAWRATYWLPRNVSRRSLSQLERDVSNLGTFIYPLS